MNDRPDDSAAESPMQRALRMKKASLKAKPAASGSDSSRRKQVAGIAAGASKPWMKK